MPRCRLALAVAAILILHGPPGDAQSTMPPPPGPETLPPQPGPETLPPPPGPETETPPAPPVPEEPAAPGTETPPTTTVPETLPPPAAAPSQPPGPASAGTPPQDREFCRQQVNFNLAPRDSIPEQYRDFVGVFSDAAWTPKLCAALIVEGVRPDGIATIVYAFGTMGVGPNAPGGTLNGTGIIQNGELKFQNSDGSQFSFKPFYSDLDGHLVTPKGDVYEAIFKRAF